VTGEPFRGPAQRPEAGGSGARLDRAADTLALASISDSLGGKISPPQAGRVALDSRRRRDLAQTEHQGSD
jgi:hypothetical protein